MVAQTRKQLSKITRKKLQLRQSLWPTLAPEKLWDRRSSDGFVTIPRALPLLLRIMDMLAPKGKPVSQTFLDLWCRTYDDSFVIVSNPREMAYYSGFTGERAERTWASRIRILAERGFIEVKSGTSGPINYVLVYNPYHIIRRQYDEGKVEEAAYNALKDRVIQIGADDLEAPIVTEDKETASNEKSGRCFKSKPKATD